MSVFKSTLLAKYPDISEKAAEAISRALEDSADQLYRMSKKNNSPEERVVLALLAAGAVKEGLKGLESAKKEIENLLLGKPANLSFADLKTESDALMIIEKIEAQRNKHLAAMSDAACGVLTGSLGILLKALTKM
jgi:hypothetical protein